MNDMIPLSPRATSFGCSSPYSSTFHQSSRSSTSTPTSCRAPRRINIVKYFAGGDREPLKSPLIVSRIPTPFRTYSAIDAGHVKLDMGFGRSSMPRRRSRRLRNLLVAITVTIVLITGAALYDRVSTRDSLRWGLDIVTQANNSDYSIPLEVNALGRFGIKGKAAQAMMDLEKGSTTPLIIEGQAENLDQLNVDGRDEVPEQALLPRRENADREVYEIPVDERLSLIKGLRRLTERMPKRYKADKGMKETRAWNIPHYKRLHNCLLTSLGEEHLARSSYLDFDAADDVVMDPKLRSLESCDKEELRVVIGGTFHFGARHFGRVSGEDIWARSTIDSYESLGYTFLYAFEIIESMEINLEIPSLVLIVMAEAGHIKDCVNWGVPGKEQKLTLGDINYGGKVVRWEVENIKSGDVMVVTADEWEEIGFDLKDSDFKETFRAVPYGFKRMYGQILSDKPGRLDKASPDYEPHENWRCVKSDAFEEGLPIWKMFAWHFWESAAHPLGHQFTLSPEDYARFPRLEGKENNLFIGYSIESYCAAVQPESERLNRAYILAKHASYFEPPKYKYSTDVFERIKASSGIDFVAGSGKAGESLPDRGIENMGMMPSDRFVEELGKSRALVGIGKPIISPTPYDALCMGVPFINPVITWSKDKPEDRSWWTWQHEGLANVKAPYVYTVKHGDEPALEAAVLQAIQNPIDRFIPSTMTTQANDARHRTIVDIDWRAVAIAKPLPDDLAHCSM